eukprot:TRINITY_DN4894_c0_g1_i4.p1 TRINITY_DN4894_c0_g1~~TRINITY_DN4894_c0_g1_i4.p1  ORF type:complete len:749 (+),score=69.19 TRINITY_DN4894_c0_g1_i4:84-2249(+)
MLKSISIFIVTIQLCLTNVYSQSSGSSFSLAHNSSYVVTLKNTTENSVQILETIPNSLNAVLASIAAATLPDLESITQSLIQGGTLDVKAISLEFGEAVNQSLVIIATQPFFRKLDVESVVAEVETKVERVLNGVGEDSELEIVTTDLANAIIGAIGNGFSEATDTSFTFKVSVSSTQAIVDPPSLSIDSNISLQTLAEENNTQAIIQGLRGELQKSDFEVVEFLAFFLDQPSLYSLLIDIFVEIFTDGEFPIDLLAKDIVQAIELNPNMSQIIEIAFIESIKDGDVQGFESLIVEGVSTRGSLGHQMIQIIESVLKSQGCTPQIAELLVSSQNAAARKQIFKNRIAGSGAVSECLSKGQENQLTQQVLISLASGNIQTAFELLSKTQVSTVVASLVFGIDQGYEIEVSELLFKYFQDDSITTEKLTYVIALFMIQQATNTSSLLIETMSDVDNIEELSATFRYAFTKGEPQVQNAFIDLITSSETNGECGLSNIINDILTNSTVEEADTIKTVLEKGGAQACLASVVPQQDDIVNVTSIQRQTPISSVSPQLVSSETSSPIIIMDTCIDITPPSGFTCAQQAAYGKCVRKWMKDGGFCAKTCGFCCEDVQPDESSTCIELKESGNCGSTWMTEGGFCEQTCGNCRIFDVTPLLKVSNTSIPTPTPTPNQVATPTFTLNQSTSEGSCNCNCGRQCIAQMTEDITSIIVEDVVDQVLKILQK